MDTRRRKRCRGTREHRRRRGINYNGNDVFARYRREKYNGEMGDANDGGGFRIDLK